MTSLREIYEEYRSTLWSKAAASMVQNAVFRHLIPAMGGPIPDTEHNRQPIPEHSIDKGMKFLETIPVEKLNKAPDLIVEALKKEGIAEAQQTRLKRCLRLFQDWGRSKGYVPQVENLIPQADLIPRNFSRFNLEPSTPLRIWTDYLKESNLDRVSRNTLQNALVRYLVPSVGGKPIEYKKKALTTEEIKQGMKVLESMPLGLFDKASEIVDRSMKSLELSRSQSARTRKVVKGLLDWARSENRLPPLLDKERNLIPWKSVEAEVKRPNYNSKQIFEAYFDHLEEYDRVDAFRRLKSVILRYVIPALGGPDVQGKRANDDDLERGLKFLEKVSLTGLWDIYSEKVSLKGTHSQVITNRHIFREMLDWACNVGYLDYPEPEYKEEVDFDFYKVARIQFIEEKSPQQKKQRAEKHTLGTFDFERNCIKPSSDIDYIELELENQLVEYKNWRLSQSAAPGGLKSEMNQILQMLGWLYRHKKIPLEDLRFENFIWKYDLIIPFDEDTDMNEYYKAANKALLLAQRGGDQNKKLVKEYLEFRDSHPKSNQRYLEIAMWLVRFLYRDTLGTDEFPTKESLPILLRLQALWKDEKKKVENSKRTYSYDERSVPWEKAILLVEYRRGRANKTINHRESPNTKRGYLRNVRGEFAIANDLQRFLSIAFCVIVFPSRARTYYELEIGRTFKEGLVIGKKFYCTSELKKSPTWDGTSKYYIHHDIKDSKVGKHQPANIKEYGWWAEVPDYTFSDGSTLYTYIRRWLHWGRNVGGKPTHNFFFFDIMDKKPVDNSCWRSRISNMFKQHYGVKVPPQNLRNMLVTFLHEQNASDEVLEAEACALEHTEETSKQHYDMEFTIKKMEPLMEFNQNFIDKTLKK